MAFDYTNLYPDTSNNGAFTKSWNYTSVVDSIATCSAVGFFNKVATRLGIGDNIVIAVVDAFDKTRTTLVEHGELFVSGISGGVVTTVLNASGGGGVTQAYVDAADALKAAITYVDAADALKASITYVDAANALKANLASPVLVTPTLGVATATTINKVSITSPAVGANLTIADGKNFTASNSLNLLGTDGTSQTFPATNCQVARTDAAQAFTGTQTFSATITGSINGNAATVTTNANLTGAVTSVGNAASLGSFTSAALATALTDETGTGANVFATSPTLVTPALGAATATTINGVTIDNTAWNPYTPALTVGSGGPLTATPTGFWKQHGKTVDFRIVIAIATNNGAGSALLAALPTPSKAASWQPLIGLDTNTFGVASAFITNTDNTTCRIYTAAGAYPGADAKTLVISGTYETA